MPFRGKVLEHNPNPRYLGKTPDSTLTDKKHLDQLSQKLKTSNNIIRKLVGTAWGNEENTLRTAAVLLVYSAAL